MSENIKEQEWRYVLFLSIPNETWTDVQKMLSRRILVQKISPVCKRLNNISNRNVKNVHVITEADRFTEKLQQGDPEADQQMQHLAGNNCQLASQFRLTGRIKIFQENTAILRHCIELFLGCRLLLYPRDQNASYFSESLTYLEPAKPTAIDIRLTEPFLVKEFLRSPTIWSCNRVSIEPPTLYVVDAMSLAVHFLDWLHQPNQQPIGVDGGDGGAEQGEDVRCLIIQCHYGIIHEANNWLVNGCLQNFQQSQGPKDRRRFVVSFSSSYPTGAARLDQFERRHHNQATGEVLLLERDEDVVTANSRLHYTVYRLRRCLAEEAANADEFYGKIFKRNTPWPLGDFVVNNGPTVEIGRWIREF